MRPFEFFPGLNPTHPLAAIAGRFYLFASAAAPFFVV